MFARHAPRAAVRVGRAALRRITRWIHAMASRRRSIVAGAPLPSGPTPDREAVARVGAVLQSCYPESNTVLEDGLTHLMLHLAVEPVELRGPGKL